MPASNSSGKQKQQQLFIYSKQGIRKSLVQQKIDKTFSARSLSPVVTELLSATASRKPFTINISRRSLVNMYRQEGTRAPTSDTNGSAFPRTKPERKGFTIYVGAYLRHMRYRTHELFAGHVRISASYTV